jgi:hypothetical protein
MVCPRLRKSCRMMSGGWSFSPWTFLVFSAAYSGSVRRAILRKVQAPDCEIGGAVINLAGAGDNFA